jgi:hypothetical protein
MLPDVRLPPSSAVPFLFFFFVFPSVYSSSSSRALLVGAQISCVPFRGSPGTAHKCDAFLPPGTSVLLTAGQTYDSVDAAAGQLTRLFGAYVPPACRTASLRLLCLSSFLPCSLSLQSGLTGSCFALSPLHFPPMPCIIAFHRRPSGGVTVAHRNF